MFVLPHTLGRRYSVLIRTLFQSEQVEDIYNILDIYVEYVYY